jgi:hypothetical protein
MKFSKFRNFWNFNFRFSFQQHSTAGQERRGEDLRGGKEGRFKPIEVKLASKILKNPFLINLRNLPDRNY